MDQIRRYLREAFGGSVHRSDWDATGRTTDQLVTGAVEEVEAWLAKGRETDGPGPASLELAVRAAYPLIVTGRLRADRGTANNDQPDRRKPGELLDTMRRSVQGTRQLGQAIRDFHVGTAIQAVDEMGAIRTMADGSGPQLVHDVYLRNEFPPDGKVKNQSSRGATPADQFNHALARFGSVLEELKDAHKSLGSVLGDDGHALVDGLGGETRLANPWRVTLKQIEDDLSFWGRTFSRNVKVKAPSTFELDANDDEREPEVDEDADLDLGNVVVDRAAAE